MQCNFQITQLVEFDGEFGNLDVHNAYDLDRLVLEPENRRVSFNFVANQWATAGRPGSFHLCIEGVTLVELAATPQDLSEFVIHEIGFMEADDREYQYALIDMGEPGDSKHLVFKTEAGIIRIDGQRADVLTIQSSDLPLERAPC